MDRFFALLLTGSLSLVTISAVAQSYDQIVWKEVALKDGITAFVSASDIRPTARLTKVSLDAVGTKKLGSAGLYDALLNLGLKYQSSIGLQDLGNDDFLVWGTAKTLNGRQKFMARFAPFGLLLFTSSSRDFNPSDAKAYFDGVTDLRVTGSFDERLKTANVDTDRALTTAFTIPRSTIVQTNAPPAAPTVEPWPKPQNANEKQALDKLRRRFPDALAPPPMLYTQPDGKQFPALYRYGDDGFFAAGTGTDAARFGYFKTELPDGGDVRAEFGRLLAEMVVRPSLRATTQEAPEWRRMHGARYWAEYGDARYQGHQIRYFIELYANTIIMIMAPHEVFASWGGPIAPLAYNGYVRDPQNLDREVQLRLQRLTAEESVRTHIMIVEKKMQNATFSFAATMNTGLMMWLQRGLAQSFAAE